MKVLLLYQFVSFLNIREIIQISRVNKFFYNLIKSYEKLWRDDLVELSIKWNFEIDQVDPTREIANYVNRKYKLKGEEFEFIGINKKSITIYKSALFLKEGSHSAYNEAIYLGKVKFLNYNFVPCFEFVFNRLMKGSYKVYLRAASDTLKFYEINSKVTISVYTMGVLSILLETNFPNPSNEQTLKKIHEINKRKNGMTKKSPNSSSVTLANIFLANLDLLNRDDWENLKVIIKFERKDPYFSFYIDGAFLTTQ
jgi:hypothetical protein